MSSSTSLPDVSAELPWSRPNMLPQALLMAAILAMMGRLWMTKPTSFFCTLARLLAWPSSPKPVTSVAPWALYLCIRRAAETGTQDSTTDRKVVKTLTDRSHWQKGGQDTDRQKSLTERWSRHWQTEVTDRKVVKTLTDRSHWQKGGQDTDRQKSLTDRSHWHWSRHWEKEVTDTGQDTDRQKSLTERWSRHWSRHWEKEVTDTGQDTDRQKSLTERWSRHWSRHWEKEVTDKYIVRSQRLCPYRSMVYTRPVYPYWWERVKWQVKKSKTPLKRLKLFHDQKSIDTNKATSLFTNTNIDTNHVESFH